jgi:hypothetical protein
MPLKASVTLIRKREKLCKWLVGSRQQMIVVWRKGTVHEVEAAMQRVKTG